MLDEHGTELCKRFYGKGFLVFNEDLGEVAGEDHLASFGGVRLIRQFLFVYRGVWTCAFVADQWKGLISSFVFRPQHGQAMIPRS